MRVARLRYRLEQQAAIVDVPLGGPFGLVYRSDRVPGCAATRTARVSLLGATLLEGLRTVRTATSIDGYTEWTEHEPVAQAARQISVGEPSTVTLRVEYGFAEGPAIVEKKLVLGTPDPGAQGFGGFLLRGMPVVDQNRLLLASGRQVALRPAGDGRRHGRSHGVIYVVEDETIVGGHDALTGRLLWRRDGDGDDTLLLGPDGSTLHIAQAGEAVEFVHGEQRSTLFSDRWVTAIETPRGKATFEIADSGLMLRLVEGDTEQRLGYGQQGRLTDIEDAHRRIVLRRESLGDGFRVSASDGMRLDEATEVRYTEEGKRREHRCCGTGSTVAVIDGATTTTLRPDGTKLERVKRDDATESTLSLPSGIQRSWRVQSVSSADSHEYRLEFGDDHWITTIDAASGRIERRSPSGRTGLTEVDERDRVTRQENLDGTWERFEWDEQSSLAADGSYGEYTIELESDGSSAVRSARGETRSVRTPTGSLWTQSSGVTMEVRAAGRQLLVRVNGLEYLERSISSSGGGRIAHGGRVLASWEHDGGATVAESEGPLRIESDPAGRPLAMTGDGIERRFEWDAGRLVKADSGDGSYHCVWDGPELIDVSPSVDSGAGLRIARDSHGRVNSVQLLGMEFDVEWTDGAITRLGPMHVDLDARRVRPARIGIGNLDERWAFDDKGRLSRREVRVHGEVVFVHSVERDPAGRVAAQRVSAEQDWHAEYTYDGDRLVGAAGAFAETISYDDNGRMTSVGGTTIDVNPAGSVMAVDGRSVALTSGGRIEKLTLDGTETVLSYNAAGEVVSISADGATTTITRDALGRAVAIRDGDDVRRLVWDRRNPIALLDDSAHVLERYVRLPNQRNPDLVIRGDVVLRVVVDQLGSPLALIDTEAGRVEQFSWSAYGKQTRGPIDFTFGYAGAVVLRHEPYIVDLGVRTYLPAIGRWAQWDPRLEAGGGTDLYGYAANDPVNNYDPSGMVVKYCYGSTAWTDIVPHGWLKTDKGERGMGPSLWPPFTVWKDEGQRSGSIDEPCVEVPGVDEDCVNRLTEPGTPIGFFGEPGPFSQGDIPLHVIPRVIPRVCHTVALEVLAKCAVEGAVETVLGVVAAVLDQAPDDEECCGPGSNPDEVAETPDPEYSPDLGYTPVDGAPALDHTPDLGFAPVDGANPTAHDPSD